MVKQCKMRKANKTTEKNIKNQEKKKTFVSTKNEQRKIFCLLQDISENDALYISELYFVFIANIKSIQA